MGLTTNPKPCHPGGGRDLRREVLPASPEIPASAGMT